MSKLLNLLSIEVIETKKQKLNYDFVDVEGDQIQTLITAINLNTRILVNGQRVVEKARINDQGGVILNLHDDFSIENEIVELSWTLGCYEYKTSVIIKQKQNVIGLMSINTLKKRLKMDYEHVENMAAIMASGDVKFSCMVDKFSCGEIYLNTLPSNEISIQQILDQEVVLVLQPTNEEKMIRLVGSIKIVDQNNNGKIKLRMTYGVDTLESKERLNTMMVGLAEKKDLKILEEYHFKALGL
jgi:hypothetical protein